MISLSSGDSVPQFFSQEVQRIQDQLELQLLSCFMRARPGANCGLPAVTVNLMKSRGFRNMGVVESFAEPPVYFGETHITVLSDDESFPPLIASHEIYRTKETGICTVI